MLGRVSRSQRNKRNAQMMKQENQTKKKLTCGSVLVRIQNMKTGALDSPEDALVLSARECGLSVTPWISKTEAECVWEEY
jgi:DNA-directed RNA polymerase subunit E'/Rpb7